MSQINNKIGPLRFLVNIYIIKPIILAFTPKFISFTQRCKSVCRQTFSAESAEHYIETAE